MIIVAKKSFNKDIARLTDAKLAQKIKDIITSLENARSIEHIPTIKKLKGSSNAFRIRIGDYRLGFFVTGNTIELAILAHRKEVYNYFP